PDACEVWADGPVGFGHTLLRTTYESLAENQPASLDRQFWITADARIDCRAELETELANAGRKVRQAAPDPELILHAYAVWGEACVQHLRGDFAFAIWDARRKTLFCARDHFGVKPFYYADLGDLFLFSNTLNCLRLHADVSDELNESAIADFLLFGLNCDEATTTFRDIRRLPPAHFLSVSAAGLRSTRYWSPPIDGRIRYHRSDEYVEHFQTLMQAAVADRLRTSRAGILLSGGLDSSAIAATARELSVKSGGTADLRAYTVTYESLLPDRDGDYAREVAEFLQIPIRCLPVDGLQLFERWDDPELRWPEPVDDPFFAGLFDQFRMVAADCRVVLEGEGMDNLMHFEMRPYVRHLARNREWRHLFADVTLYLRLRPSIWPGVRRRFTSLLGRGNGASEFPQWFEPGFAKRMSLQDRWRELSVVRTTPAHPVVPVAHASLTLPQWSHSLELQDPGVTRCAVEVRHPFLDLRIVDYVLALPPFPWSFQKRLLREAMAGHLPESVRLRPKTPLAGDSLVEMLQRPGASAVDQACWTEQIDHYVNTAALPVLYGERNPELASAAIRPLCLNFWLQSVQRVRYNNYAEARNG
ncbi:MAG: asparagine synthase-related protein, partial [Candidatus Acidiferrales bacterium]